jgi:hypothetical protein
MFGLKFCIVKLNSCEPSYQPIMLLIVWSLDKQHKLTKSLIVLATIVY